MKVLLITLPREGEALDYTTRDYLLTDFSKYPPLGLMAIASKVDPRHSTKLYDANIKALTVEETVQYIKQEAPDLLGMSVVTRRLWAMSEIARRVRQELPSCKIVVGGPHINYWPRETMQISVLDYAISGYAEFSFPALVEAIDRGSKPEELRQVPELYWRENGQVRNNPGERTNSKSLDHVPFARRDLLNVDDYYTAVDMARMTTTYSSRGCPYRCIYCDVQEKAYLYRSAKNMADEFEELIKMGIREIHIFDDVFNIRKPRVLEFCEEIKKRKIQVRWSIRARVNPWDRETLKAIYEAGCHRIHVGVESLDEPTLTYMNKRQSLEDIKSFFKICNSVGIETLAYFIIGFPTESDEYRRNLFKKVIELNPTYCFFNILFPLAKTQYYQSLLDDGTYERDHWAEYFTNPTRDFELPLPRSPELQRELEDLADSFHRRFCYRMGFLWKEFWRSVRYPPILWLKFKLAFVLARETILWRRKHAPKFIGTDAELTPRRPREYESAGVHVVH
jgi:radical SAM superfamily enzyme YgiQ (UPF0313 family)